MIQWFLRPKEKAATEGTGLKTLTPKQMLQRLPIALAQVNADHNSESLLNEIRQIVYSLYESVSITLSNLSIYNTWENIKSSYNNNKFKISSPTWNDKIELPNGSYSVSDSQD